MGMSTRILRAMPLLLAATTALSQNLQCPDIAKTLKEYSIDSSSSSYLNAVFTQHCQTDGSRKSAGAGLGIDAVVKAIPIKFTGNYSNSSEAMTSFCKAYSSQTFTSAASDSYKETISLKALETIGQCNMLQAGGYTVSHQVANVESANFYLRSSVTQAFEMQGVSTTGGAICEGLVDGKKRSFDSALNVKIKATLSFSCKRTGLVKERVTSYPESIVTVLTNQGNYSLFWPRDERQSEDMAVKIDKRITSIEGDLAVTNASVRPLVTSDSVQIYSCPRGLGAGRNAAWQDTGCNGQLSRESTCINTWATGPTESRDCALLGTMKIVK
jgi:hypothetical protein